MGFTKEDKEARKFEDDPDDSAKFLVRTKVENPTSDPIPVEIVNSDASIDIEVESTTKLYDGSAWVNQSSDSSGRAIIKQKKYYSAAEITALGSSTSVEDWAGALSDEILLKEYTSSFNGTNKKVTYYTHPSLGNGNKCIRVVNTYHSGGGVETSFPTVQDWSYDSFATPAAVIAL